MDKADALPWCRGREAGTAALLASSSGVLETAATRFWSRLFSAFWLCHSVVERSLKIQS